MDLDRACRADGTFGVRWRCGRRWRPSFRFPEGNKMLVERVNRRHARVKLPRLGWVRFRLSRPLDGALIRSATLTRDGQHWSVSLLVDDGRDTPAEHARAGTAVGVDRGVVVAIATSENQLVDRDFVSAGGQRRALRLQRRLARAARRGANRNRTRAALAQIRAREARRRQDFCAKTAHQLTEAHALVVLEALNTNQMTRSARGTLDRPRRQCQREVRAQPRHPRQGMAPVRAGAGLGGALQRHSYRDSAAAVHVATLLSVWAGGPEIP